VPVNQNTELYGVVGYPLDHSLSPVMHNTAFLKAGLRARYLALETRDIKGCLRKVRDSGIKGLSVTLPFKSVIIPYLDHIDRLAQKINAVNTVVNDAGCLIGYNTDAHGAGKALEGVLHRGSRCCLIVGAGGAARAIGFMLKEQGMDLTVANRSVMRGVALARSLECPFVPLEEVEAVCADLLIQTTPVGMFPHTDRCIVPLHALREGMVVMDIIYNPLKTRLLTMAGEQGCKTISGLEMFVHQGAEQFRLWTHMKAPVAAMTRAVKAALRENSQIVNNDSS